MTAHTAEDPLALEQQVCFAVVVAARSVVALYKPVLEPMGLTHPQYLVMLALWQDTPQTASRLSQTLALDPGTLSPLLKRLEAAGLVARERDTRDERQLAVRLTERGTALRTEAEKVPAAIAARLGMDPTELATLRDDLTRVIVAAQD
ncbi:MarR family winged helix-turn-helix transcriptional regulator [Nakamurella deserti]|uniref:MarR family winged helix-turn-helix transcriptional regulator n=1 Tax=Nakamurella deserti TaxID=2164074 RepID=UPI000DBE434C|nr:MarR family transcriptional regulator [Nakamurella deserti]